MALEIPGLKEYGTVKEAYEELTKILERAADLKAHIARHKAGAELLRLEKGEEFDATQKAVDEALAEAKKDGTLEKVVHGSEAVEMYERLLKTPLYDASCRQWNYIMSPDYDDVHHDRFSSTQLAGVIALAFIGRQDDARKVYEMLTKTELYDMDRMQWNAKMSAEQNLEDSDREAYPNLLGIVALASIGQEDKAKAAYDMLAETLLYDKERKQWNSYMNAKQKLKGSRRESGTGLAGIAALCLIGRKEDAEERYMLLENSILHDKARKQWNASMTESEQLETSARNADDQLLGIITLCLLDKKQEAKERYAYLAGENCSLYDREKMQWNRYMSPGQYLKSSNRSARDQLLGVAALAALER